MSGVGDEWKSQVSGGMRGGVYQFVMELTKNDQPVAALRYDPAGKVLLEAYTDPPTKIPANWLAECMAEFTKEWAPEKNGSE